MFVTPEIEQSEQHPQDTLEVYDDGFERVEHIASLVSSRVPSRAMAYAISSPDIPGKTAIDQVQEQFSYENDPDAWRTNVTLLAGIAAGKLLDGPKNHDPPPLILGYRPQAIVSHYVDIVTAQQADSAEHRLPYPRSLRMLKRHSWFNPDTSSRLFKELRSLAATEFRNHVYSNGETADMLNPKVAYLWGGPGNWGMARRRDSEFHAWLDSFQDRAKYLMMLDLVTKIEAGDQRAYLTVRRLLNGRTIGRQAGKAALGI